MRWMRVLWDIPICQYSKEIKIADKNQIEKDRSVADEKNCIRHTLVFLCCVILDNRESVYIAYSVLFLYNIEINVLGN